VCHPTFIGSLEVSMLAAGRRPLRLVLVVLVVLGLGSCGTSQDNQVARGITVQEFAFNPDPYLADVGDDITVVNLDGVVHTLTADDGSLDTGRLKSGADDAITVTRPGVTSYHCDIHDFMRGRIRAEEPAPST
jgi:plastocyanin